MIDKRYMKPGVVILDVGINIIADDTRKSGQRLVGDVNFKDGLQLASQITPVPGGVGAMTIAMLMSNTIMCYNRTMELQNHLSTLKISSLSTTST